MTLRKFNDEFYRFKPEPQINSLVKIVQKPYRGSGDRWYMDVELTDKSIVTPYHNQLRDSCPATFIEGHMKLKIPMMKGVFTYTHRSATRLTDFQDGETINVVISCAGMFNLKGVWKPSWKLKVIEV